MMFGTRSSLNSPAARRIEAAAKALRAAKMQPDDIASIIREGIDRAAVRILSTLGIAGAEPIPPLPLVERRQPMIADIQRAVALHFGVSRADMVSERRTKDVMRPRQVAMYLAKTLTAHSLPEIGRRFGGRDHTTVLHAVRKMDALVKTDDEVRAHVRALTDILGGPVE